MSNKRQNPRQEVVRPVYFNGEADNDNFAFSVNVSLCGVCIITNREIHVGDSVVLHSRFFWGEPKRAKAVWSEEVSQKTRKVGLSLCLDN